MDRYSITIFTPTYNRAHTLPELYQSLCFQSCKDFEWIVVDDGSTDGTNKLIEGWIGEKKISIRYFFQENAGKMAAHNLAVDHSRSDWFMCLDSDDKLFDQHVVDNCIHFWQQMSASLSEEVLSKVCGIISYKSIRENHNLFPRGMQNVHLSELRRSGYKGETVIMVKSAILTSHKFPHFEGEKFVTDTYLYEQLDKDHIFLLMDSPTQICKYNPDGYSFNYRRLLFSNPLGYRAYHDQRIALGQDGKLKSAICYDAISIRIGMKSFLSSSSAPLLCILMLPAGFCKYLIDSYHLKTFKSLC